MFWKKRSVVDLATEVVERARAMAPGPACQKAAQDCLEAAKGAAPDEVQRALVTLAPTLGLPDDNRAFLVAYLCGALVEGGAATDPIEEAIVGRFAALAGSARRFHSAVRAQMPDEESKDADDEGSEEDDAEEAFETVAERLAPSMPEEAGAFERLASSFAPATTVLSASVSARRRARPMLSDLRAMSADNAGASWLAMLADVVDDEPYLAIEPATDLGISGRMTGIADNFQLNVLLMDLFPTQTGQRPSRVSAAAAAIARGQGPQQLDEQLTGAWDLHTWQALEPTGRLPAGTGEAATRHWIWNEGVPADIPVFEGARVILLGPASYERGWTAQRSFAALRAEMTVEKRLGAEDVRDWIRRMATATAKPA